MSSRVGRSSPLLTAGGVSVQSVSDDVKGAAEDAKDNIKGVAVRCNRCAYPEPDAVLLCDHDHSSLYKATRLHVSRIRNA